MTNELITGALIQRVMRETGIGPDSDVDHEHVTGIIYAAGNQHVEDMPWEEADEVLGWKIEDEDDHVFMITVDILGVDLRTLTFTTKDVFGHERSGTGADGVRRVLEFADSRVNTAVSHLSDLISQVQS